MTTLNLFILLITTSLSQISYYKQFDDGYILVNETQNYFTANRFCDNQWYITLASIHDSTSNQQAADLCATYSNTPCWIGLNDVLDFQNYLWLDNTDYNFNNLSINTNNSLRCIAIYNNNWIFADCNNDQYTFICNAVNSTRSPTTNTISPSPSPSIQPTALPSKIPTPSPTQPPRYPLVTSLSTSHPIILAYHTKTRMYITARMRNISSLII